MTNENENVLLHNIQARREEWKELRKKTVGSSEIATIAGLNKFQTPLQLWAEKTGRTPPVEENEHMRLGTHLEPFIGSLFARQYGKSVFANTNLYVHPVHDFATATPDFFVTEHTIEEGKVVVEKSKGILECKNTSAHNLPNWQDGNIPNTAHLQIIWQMGIVGMAKGWVAALVGGNPNDFFAPPVDFDSSVFDQCLELAASFMEMVRKDIPPAARAADVKFLDSLHKREKKSIPVTEKALNLIHEYQAIQYELEKFSAQTEPLEGRRDTIKAQLIQLLGDSEEMVGEGFVVSAKTVNRASYVAKASSYTKFSLKELK